VAVGEETDQSGGVSRRARLNGGRRFPVGGRCRPLQQARASPSVMSWWCRRGKGGAVMQGGAQGGVSREGGRSRGLAVARGGRGVAAWEA
jgi:hypothetical protein